MKKLLFLLAAACLLISCNSQDEVLNPKSEALPDESQNEISLRSTQETCKALLDQFFLSSNQKQLYEYLSYSGAIHTDTYVVATYYTDINEGSSFTDPLSGRVFFYKRIIGKIGHSIPARSNKAREVFDELWIGYSPTSKQYKMCNVDIIDRNFYLLGYQPVRQIGFTAYPIHNDIDVSKFEDGTWGFLRQYYSSHQGGCRTFAERAGVDYSGLPIWNGGKNSLGIVVLP